MQKIAQFEKVSFEQFIKDWIDCFPFYNKDNIKKIYDNISSPKEQHQEVQDTIFTVL